MWTRNQKGRTVRTAIASLVPGTVGDTFAQVFVECLNGGKRAIRYEDQQAGLREEPLDGEERRTEASCLAEELGWGVSLASCSSAIPLTPSGVAKDPWPLGMCPGRKTP